MIPLILLTILTKSVDCLQDTSFLSAHGGIFRSLDWTNDELAEVSALHTTASYHTLMRLIAKKLSESDIDDDERRRIEKFMVRNRPPKFLEDFLSEDDRKTLLQHHAAGDFHQYALLLFRRLLELPKHQAIAALRYFGHKREADYLDEADCYACAVVHLSRRLAR